MQRTATLFNRTGASSTPLVNGTYPSSLVAALGEEQVYHPGLYETYPAAAAVARAAGGNPVKLKFQGTADFPDALLIGDSTARISLVASSSGKSFQLTQATGASVSTSHSTASGLTTIALGTDALGRGNVTPAALVAYIAANLSATFTGTAIATGGVMGAMDRAVAVPISPRWIDLESTRQDTSTTAFEHTLDPGAGGSATYGFRVKSQGWRAVRAIACSSGAPDTADSIAVTMGLPG
jgi:hypothetical protein